MGNRLYQVHIEHGESYGRYEEYDRLTDWLFNLDANEKIEVSTADEPIAICRLFLSCLDNGTVDVHKDLLKLCPPEVFDMNKKEFEKAYKEMLAFAKSHKDNYIHLSQE